MAEHVRRGFGARVWTLRIQGRTLFKMAGGSRHNSEHVRRGSLIEARLCALGSNALEQVNDCLRICAPCVHWIRKRFRNATLTRKVVKLIWLSATNKIVESRRVQKINLMNVKARLCVRQIERVQGFRRSRSRVYDPALSQQSFSEKVAVLAACASDDCYTGCQGDAVLRRPLSTRSQTAIS